MKIYSWNIYFRNGQLEKAFAFIKALDFDVLCLQEVPETFLARLQELPVHLAYAPEVDRLFSHGTERNYLVILSRYKILSQNVFPFAILHLPFRTRLFIRVMRRMHWSRVANRNGFFADISVPHIQTPMRVFCLHLVLAHPEARRKEFGIAMREYDKELPTVVCGDFNILDTPYVTFFNWLLGGKMSDAVLWRRERRAFEREISALGLVNPHYGKRTHILAKQLDHILVSRSLSIESARVALLKPGSDHYPVHVEIATTT